MGLCKSAADPFWLSKPLSLSLSIPFQTPPERDWFTSAVNHEGDEKLVAILFFFLPRSNTNIEIYDVVYVYICMYIWNWKQTFGVKI